MRFRFRSAARDEAAITDRLGSIERCILNAITAAEAEKMGFARRLDAARGRACVLMGTEQLDAFDREEKTESLLADSERELVEAGKRIDQLTAHIRHLHRVLEILKQK